MSLIHFISNDSLLEADVSLEGHRVQLTFKNPVSTIAEMISTGFEELNENNYMVMSDFKEHKYLYHEEVTDYVFIITDDPSDEYHDQPFVPPTPPEPYIPTLEELKAMKVSEMENAMSQAIVIGPTVTLSDGTEGTFGLSMQNQTSLTNLRLMAEATEDKETPSIPWHISDEDVHCQYFSPNDMMTITDAAILLTTFNISFFRDLRIYINALTTKPQVESITYDINILPYEYWSDPLKDIVNRMNTTS